MRTRCGLVACVAFALVFGWTEAQAQWFQLPSGPGAFYLGVEGGFTGIEDERGHVVGSGIGFNERRDDGFNVGARFGYEWGPWRFEEEYRFQENGGHALALPELPPLKPRPGTHLEGRGAALWQADP